jgi:hypothetical protein
MLLVLASAVALAQAPDQQAQFKQFAQTTIEFLRCAQLQGVEAGAMVQVQQFQEAIATGGLAVSIPAPPKPPKSGDENKP